MDPTATLKLWLDDPDSEVREDLAEWLTKGGFPPDINTVRIAYEYCSSCHAGMGSEEYAMLSLLMSITLTD